ncbi:MAG: hemin uptake protein HemP [Roseateles sp.]|uniref:hemin uptake protein HemP n=1 Tax=Roseateles sp. TaxID=1971397 RepID=UPI0040369A46
MPVDVPPRQALTPPSPPGSLAGAGAAPRIDSAALLGRRGEVFIVHHQQVYRLRVTAQGKLILTK